MNSKIKKCQSCLKLPAEVFEPAEDNTYYELCRACHHRLITFSLRPIEWYRLVLLHSRGWHLCEDFYIDEGIAIQSHTEESIDIKGYELPKFYKIKNNLSKLLDFALVKYEVDRENEIYQQIRSFPGNEIWQMLLSRYKKTSLRKQNDIVGMMDILLSAKDIDADWLIILGFPRRLIHGIFKNI